jgi:hypothetical protein
MMCHYSKPAQDGRDTAESIGNDLSLWVNLNILVLSSFDDPMSERSDARKIPNPAC